MGSNLRMLDPIHPEGNVPAPSSPHTRHFLPLAAWARSPRAEADLERIYGPSLNWPIAFQWLESFRRSDFSQLPPVHTLSSSAMPGLWGGYSRETREIYLAADCPPHLVASVLLEEVGHFLDQELCNKETPGDEGALFAACVLGDQPMDADFSSWAAEESLSPVFHSGRRILVEAAPKVRGSGSTGTSSSSGGKVRGGSGNQGSRTVGQNTENSRIIGDTIYAVRNSARLTQTKAGQTMIGSGGNDTFVVMSSDAKIEDPDGGIDTVEAKVSFDLSKFSFIENLTAAPGTTAVTLGGNSNANVITGNSGNNRLDGGADRARDTLSGGLGNDTYVIRDTLDAVVEASNGGSDTIETTINNYTLNFANVENVAFVGAGSATLTGNSLANVLTGGTLGDTLFGDVRDTLAGSAGDDFYIVLSPSAVIRENLTDTVRGNDGSLLTALGGNDTISTGLATYSMDRADNVEVLVYTGSQNSSLAGNSVDNIILGGNTVRNNINGGAGNDSIVGGRLTDSLVGGLGNDTLLVSRWSDSPVGALGTALEKGTGADVLDGGAGADWYVVDSQTAYTFKETGNERDTIASTTTFSLKYNTNISDNIENLYLLGKDSLRGTGSAKDNEITGNDGNNTLSAEAGNDTVYGGLGADRISGDAGNDTIYGGGLPQGDLPANASTAITMRSGEVYVGSIDARRDSDWIRVELEAGITYTFEIDFTANGTGVLAGYSDAAFGQAGYDFTLDPSDIPFRPYIADSRIALSTSAAYSEVSEGSHRFEHRNLVLDKTGARADGALDYNYDYFAIPGKDALYINKNENVQRFTFIPFTSGEFYVPISGAGPLGGRYTVKISDAQTTGYESKKTLSDDASNVLIGGLGQDLLVAGNGRDTLGDPLGDSLFGGTNGIPGGVDVDLTAAINEIKTSQDYSSAFRDDTLFAATNNTLFARVGDTLLGAGGTNTILVVADEVIETPNNVIQLGNGQSYSEGNLLYIGFTVDPTDRNAKTNVAVNSGDSLVSGSQRDFTAEAEKFTGTNAQTQLANLKTQTTIIRQTELLRNGDTLVAAADNAFKSQVGDTLVSAIAGGFEYTVFVNPGDVINYPGGFFVLSADDDLLEGSLPPSGLGINYTAQTRGILANESLIGGSGRMVINGFNNKIVIHRIGADTLLGGKGNDLLDGGNGRDSMAGGLGNDTYYIDDLGSFLGQTSIRTAGDRVLEADNGGTDLAIINSSKNPFREDLSGSNFQKDLQDGLFNFDDPTQGLDSVTGWGFDVDLKNAIQNVEHASLMGSKNLYVLGNEDSNSLFGNFGSNLLVGGGGDDSLDGEGGIDYLIGGEGGDWLDGGSGQNTMDGGFGDDTYTVNDRDDRIIKEIAGLDGGQDLVRTYFNFDPIQGLGINPITGEVIIDYQPGFEDNAPSFTKSRSFASKDITTFYNLENFDLLGQAAYAVGNALDNKINTAKAYSALVLGMGGNDSIFGTDDIPNQVGGDDSLYGDTPEFYASPDLYSSAPNDTQNQEFLDSVIGEYGNDHLEGGFGDDYLDGGRGFDTMIGGRDSDTFVQDNVDDYIDAVSGEIITSRTNQIPAVQGLNELISSVNISKAPDGISKLMLVVADQAEGSGQKDVAGMGSFEGTKLSYNRSITINFDQVSVTLNDANTMELMYSAKEAEKFTGENLSVSPLPNPDPKNPGRFQFELAWVAAPFFETGIVGYTVRYRQLTDSNGNTFLDPNGHPDIWHTFVNGTSQDMKGIPTNPSLTVNNLAEGSYDFEVVAHRLAIPVLRNNGTPIKAQHVTLKGGSGNDAVNGYRLSQLLPGGLLFDHFTLPLLYNNPLPLGFIFSPEPYEVRNEVSPLFATWLDGGFGNDLLNGPAVNDRSGDDYEFQGVIFKGLNTLFGGQGSDTFVVQNGGNVIGDEFDWVVKYGSETPVNFGTGGIGNSLNGGQHNLVVSYVDFLTLSDSLAHQGQFVDRMVLASSSQFGMGNRLENYLYDTGLEFFNTLVGNTSRDSIEGYGKYNLLIGGTAYGTDHVGNAVRDFASALHGGFGLLESIYRDTDPVPTNPNGPGASDPSQFWNLRGYYGNVYDPDRNQDTLIANKVSTLDGGAGKDLMSGSATADQVKPSDFVFNITGDVFFVSQGQGGIIPNSVMFEDAVFGNGGNDTVMFTDSDYLWWSGHMEGELLDKNGYTIRRDISNLILQAGSPSARYATGNNDSKGNYGEGSNYIVGNEFDNRINGAGVGGEFGFGVGVDILEGGSGKDNFIVNGYKLSKSNAWSPNIVENTSGELAGFSIWNQDKSIYTDSDYAVILDFEPGDNLALASQNLDNYWIGAAPSSNQIPELFNDNLDPLGYLQSPNTTRFGIYDNQGASPNLVAVINLVGNLELDTLTLQLAYDPIAPDNSGRFTAKTGTPEARRLGWGTFWKLKGSNFAQYVNQTFIPEDSFASLETLVRSGDDLFQGGFLAESFNGYGGNDSLLGGGNNDTLTGNSGNDYLFGEAGNDSLIGGIGADFIDGGIGNDQMIGGLGDDTFNLDSLLDNVVEQSLGGTDLVVASVSGYTLTEHVEYLELSGNAISGYGNSLNNRLFGNGLRNTLGGGDGNDTLNGDAGRDTLQGGDGDDIYIVDSTTDTIEDSLGIDAVLSSVSYDLSNLDVNGGTGIEHLFFTGTAAGGSLIGNSLNNSIVGGGRSDTLNGGNGVDTLIGGFGDDFYVLQSNDPDTIDDKGGRDTALVTTHFNLSTLAGGAAVENLQLTASGVSASLTGNQSNNYISGNNSNDTIEGLGVETITGSDTLDGRGGDDLYIVDSNLDLILDSGGNDTILTSVSFDLSNSLVGGGTAIENIVFSGSNGSTLTGNEGANSITGGGGVDLMIGGKGNDTYFVDASGLDQIQEINGGGTDWVICSKDFNLAENGKNVEYLSGNSVNNFLTGNELSNILDGGAGDDTLTGTTEINNLEIDTLIGGTGRDLFVIGNSTRSLYAKRGVDDFVVIQDFNPNESDKILYNGAETLNVSTGMMGDGFFHVSILVGSTLDLVAKVKSTTGELSLAAHFQGAQSA